MIFTFSLVALVILSIFIILYLGVTFYILQVFIVIGICFGGYLVGFEKGKKIGFRNGFYYPNKIRKIEERMRQRQFLTEEEVKNIKEHREGTLQELSK